MFNVLQIQCLFWLHISFLPPFQKYICKELKCAELIPLIIFNLQCSLQKTAEFITCWIYLPVLSEWHWRGAMQCQLSRESKVFSWYSTKYGDSCILVDCLPSCSLNDMHQQNMVLF